MKYSFFTTAAIFLGHMIVCTHAGPPKGKDFTIYRPTGRLSLASHSGVRTPFSQKTLEQQTAPGLIAQTPSALDPLEAADPLEPTLSLFEEEGVCGPPTSPVQTHLHLPQEIATKVSHSNTLQISPIKKNLINTTKKTTKNMRENQTNSQISSHTSTTQDSTYHEIWANHTVIKNPRSFTQPSHMVTKKEYVEKNLIPSMISTKNASDDAIHTIHTTVYDGSLYSQDVLAQGVKPDKSQVMSPVEKASCEDIAVNTSLESEKPTQVLTALLNPQLSQSVAAEDYLTLQKELLSCYEKLLENMITLIPPLMQAKETSTEDLEIELNKADIDNKSIQNHSVHVPLEYDSLESNTVSRKDSENHSVHTPLGYDSVESDTVSRKADCPHSMEKNNSSGFVKKIFDAVKNTPDYVRNKTTILYVSCMKKSSSHTWNTCKEICSFLAGTAVQCGFLMLYMYYYGTPGTQHS